MRFIEDGAARMRLLIHDILDYSKIGQVNAFEEVDLNQLLGELSIDLQVAIQRSNAEISVEQLPKVYGVKQELRLLFQNLIGNAIKFKKPGINPKIDIGVEQENTIFVKDNGIGMNPKYHEKVFQIFKRLHGKSEYEGTGIGLAHCHKIVQNHGGEIWVESKEGEGCKFLFTLKTNSNG